METSQSPPAYQVYILRMWQDQTASSGWCFSLEDPSTSQRRGFASLEALTQFLQGQYRLGQVRSDQAQVLLTHSIPREDFFNDQIAKHSIDFCLVNLRAGSLGTPCPGRPPARRDRTYRLPWPAMKPGPLPATRTMSTAACHHPGRHHPHPPARGDSSVHLTITSYGQTGISSSRVP